MGFQHQTFQLTLHDTNVLKGIALVLLLCHHCWYLGEDYSDIVVLGYPVFKEFGIFCKLCVSVFVFLSGYGLTKVAMKNSGLGNLLNFYRRRYVKLMMNYWLIWLLFVPMGLLFFQRSFPDVYGAHYILKGVVDFLGLYQAIFATPYGYNATWWFYSCIIVLYLIYPLIWRFRFYWFLMIPLSILAISFWRIPFIGSSGAMGYLLAFVCGMTYAHVKVPVIGGGNFGRLILILLFCLICSYRFLTTNAILWDASIIVSGIYLYKVLPSIDFLSKPLAFLGKHSFNIFLFHTFIYAYYFHEYIYWSKNPVLIVFTLLIVCIFISVGIEQFRKLLRIDQLQNKLITTK